MFSRNALLAIVALIGTAEAFAPAALPMGLRQRSATAKISGYAIPRHVRTVSIALGVLRLHDTRNLAPCICINSDGGKAVHIR